MLFQQLRSRRARVVYLLGFVLIPLALAAQGPWTTPPSTNGKVRIASTADDALCVGGTAVAPVTTDCGGGIYTAKVAVTGTIKATASSGFESSQVFRGLHLRTHPDADVSAAKLELLKADEIITDDGARFSAVSNLVADMGAAAGAGALDTGAEAASTWYEVYFIAKDDGTQNLLLHRSLNYSKDTSFETADNNGRLLRIATATATDRLDQGVQFANAGALNFIDVVLNRNNVPVGRAWFSIQADSAGNASGTPLATTDKMDVATITTSTQWVRFIFRTPFTVTASTQYHLVMEGDYTRSDTVNIGWRGVTAGGYVGGSAKEYNGATWSAATGPADFNFKAYLTANSAAVTMPSGYTRKAKIGYVYNDGSSNFSPFVARNASVRRLSDAGGSFGSLTSIVPTLVNISAMAPPGLVQVHAVGYNSAVTNYVAMAPVPDGYGYTVSGAGDHGVVYFNSAGAGFAQAFDRFSTETQGLYASASAGTGTINITGFEW